MEAKTLPIDLLVPREDQPRKYMDATTLLDITESIKRLGILEPILVRPLPDGRYEIIAGERRYRAAKSLGMAEVPVVVREVEDEKRIKEFSIAENSARQDLSLGEIVLAVRDYFRELSDEEFWNMVGKARSAATSGRLDRYPEPLLHAALAFGLSPYTLAQYLYFLFGQPREVLEGLARASLSLKEAERIRKDPSLLAQFLREVERLKTAPVQAHGLSPEQLAKKKVFQTGETRRGRKRRSRLHVVVERWELLVEGLYDLGEEAFAQRLEALLKEFEAAKGLQ